MTASLGSSILPIGTLGDPIALEFSRVIQTKRTPTCTTRLATIPQYTHDISHLLACESRESSLRTPLRCQAIHPLSCLVFHLGECSDFSAMSR